MSEFATDEGLREALVDLGARIRVPASSMWARVHATLAETDQEPRPRRLPGTRRGRVLVAIAVAVVLLLSATLSIAPARRAVADFFGIGSTEVRRVDRNPRGVAPEGLPRSGDVQALRAELARAGLVLPDGAVVGSPTAWRVEPQGETVVAFERVVLSQRPAGEVPVIKLVPRANTVEPVMVGSVSALWIPGDHRREIAGRVYRSTSALLWVDRGLELRLEGDLPLDRMLRIARSVEPVT